MKLKPFDTYSSCQDWNYLLLKIYINQIMDKQWEYMKYTDVRHGKSTFMEYHKRRFFNCRD